MSEKRLRGSWGPGKKFRLLLADLLIFAGPSVLIFAYRFRLDHFTGSVLKADGFWFMAAALISLLYIFGAYDLSAETPRKNIFIRVIFASGATLLTGLLVLFLLGKDRSGIFGRGVFLSSMLSFVILATLVRYIAWVWLRRDLTNRSFLCLTDLETATYFAAELKLRPFPGQMFVLGDAPAEMKSAGSIEDLPKWRHRDFDGVLIASKNIPAEIQPTLLQMRWEGIPVHDLSQFYETSWRKLPVYHIDPEFFYLGSGFDLIENPWRLRLKRVFDLALAIPLLILFSPFMLLTALAVKLDSAGPALYRQVRTGYRGQNFTIMKFRSMRTDAEKAGPQWAQASDDRVTRVGRFIRLTRLDELPQIFNVFRGDMSFIGPRPERPEFVEDLRKKIPHYDLRHLVPPGLSGWAQVLYPYGASVDDARQKLEFDLYYVKNQSLLLDLKVLLKTIQVVVLGRGR